MYISPFCLLSIFTRGTEEPEDVYGRRKRDRRQVYSIAKES